MQTLRPQFTAQSIFDQGRERTCRRAEIGFGNLAIGTLGLASLAKPGWVLPAALAGILRKTRNLMEQIALVSDLAIFALLAVFVASRAF